MPSGNSTKKFSPRSPDIVIDTVLNVGIAVAAGMGISSSSGLEGASGVKVSSLRSYVSTTTVTVVDGIS